MSSGSHGRRRYPTIPFMSPSPLVLVLTTCADAASAERMAQVLVGERLAACVNVHGAMRSIYRWKGAVEQASEVQVVVKTTRRLAAAVEARIRALHDYELPELLVLSIDGGGADYLEWIRTETSHQAGGGEPGTR